MAHEIPDPHGDQTRTEFARALTALRTGEDLTVRELARRVDAPVATLGDHFAGRHPPKPSQIDLFRAIVAECGVNDLNEIERWLRALDPARYASDGRAAKRAAPYRGLEPYGEEYAELLFGRAAALAEVLDHLRALRDALGPSAGMLVLVGPSGSGKSSLLGAGLVPALRQGALDTGGRHLGCTLTTPSGAPDALGPSASEMRKPSVLVFDQLEEVLVNPAGSAP